MLYPCTNCLVDIVCIKPCDNLISYSNELIYTQIPRDIVKNETRLKRVRTCFSKYVSSSVNKKIKFDRGFARIWNDVIAQEYYEKMNKILQNS
jgi:hypothetical protein